ncbi:MAG: [LysW]-aminoadipate kinase [Holophagales bacterium]|nr:[LysW]-aminoadipate kinase [Holophagales bacterium]MYF96267.1 [LysW]-aminoadipate kinase [Holophagales bacterium]
MAETSPDNSAEPLVVKAGGGKALDIEAIAADVGSLWRAGRRVVLVHGGAETTNEVAEQLGHPPQFVTSESGYSSRRTDRRTLEIFEMVYCGLLNKRWVELLQRQGVAAVGLSGLDGRLFEGRRKDKLRIRHGGRRMVLRDDWTGTVEKVNGELLSLLLSGGYLPVLTPPGASFDGEAVNVDGDRAAAALATALGASTLVYLSGTRGLLADFPNEDSLIPRFEVARDALSGGAPDSGLEPLAAAAEDRMKKKVLGAAEALRGGTGRVIFADGRVERPVQAALDGAGTHVVVGRGPREDAP